MSVCLLDVRGFRCPQPVIKIAIKAPDMNPGDILEVVGDCPTFEKDVRAWCGRTKRVVLFVKDEGNRVLRLQIQF